jgi:SAM-dependent methyltransferase
VSVNAVSPERVESNKIIAGWAKHVCGDVLSLGSGGDIDKQGKKYRDYFIRAKSYTTSDIDYTMGCDLTLDARHMPLIRDCSFDGVFVSGVLEHVDEYRDAIKEIWRVLRPDGVLLLGVPFKQPEHRRPNDFRRFTRDGIVYDLTRMGSRFGVGEIVPVGDPSFPYGFWVRAVKVTG